MRILVVEDDADAADALATLLHRAGHEPAVVTTVAAALEHARPDVVIADRRLPDGDGLTVCRALRGPATRVVLLTGDEVSPADAHDVDAYVLKPAGLRDVLAALG